MLARSAIQLGVLIAAGPLIASTQPLDGVWRSQGWGYVYRIDGDSWQSFEVTSTTCVPAFKAHRRHLDNPGREATFRSSDGDVFYIEKDPATDTRRVVHPGGLTGILIERLAALPAICAPPTPNTPLG